MRMRVGIRLLRFGEWAGRRRAYSWNVVSTFFEEVSGKVSMSWKMSDGSGGSVTTMPADRGYQKGMFPLSAHFAR